MLFETALNLDIPKASDLEVDQAEHILNSRKSMLVAELAQIDPQLIRIKNRRIGSSEDSETGPTFAAYQKAMDRRC